MKLYNKSLNSLFWKNKIFNKNIRIKILKIVKDFLNSVDIDIPVKDIRLTGSLASFNYNKYSDLDVHIITNFKEINDDVDLVREALNDKRFIWNLKHNIMLNGHEVELYFEDEGETHIASGIYSIKNNSWVKEPKYNPPENVDVELVNFKSNNIEDTINRLYNKLRETQDKQESKEIYNRAKRIKDKVIKVRKQALASRGEFALENLVFKQLRNRGSIEKLIDIMNLSYDKFFMESLIFNKIYNKFV